MKLYVTQLFFIPILIIGCLASCTQQPKADLIISNGPIYTMEEGQPTAEAVAVADGKIIFVGAKEEAMKLADEETQKLDLGGKTMTPGLIESHAHFMGVGNNILNVNLINTRSYDEVIQKVEEAIAKAQPGEWILGRGWHQSKWDSLPGKMVKGFQTHDLLSAISPENPVYLRHASGHAGFANAKAMEIAGITQLATDKVAVEVEGGEVLRDEFGNATGVFNETAMGLITQHIPDQSSERMRKAAGLAFEECLAHGITSFHDAGIDSTTQELYFQLLEEGKMKIRMYAMLSSSDTALLQRWYERGPAVGLGDNFLTIRSIKMYVDGALGSRGAWLLEPYSDRPGHYGHETTPIPYVQRVTEAGLQHGFQLCSHAIGDRANREVLDIYERAFQKYPEKVGDHRFRVEHAQHISDEDIPRFAEMGVIPSMQAIHMSSDRPWAVFRLGLGRIVEGAYVWQKLLQSGARVINGTDAPVEPISPIASFYASVTRKTLKGEPEGGYEPDQRMTREQALRSYTLDAAYGAFEENIKGSIKVGKLADFTVYSQDLMTVPDEKLLDTQVAMTIVDGKVLYERKQGTASL